VALALAGLSLTGVLAAAFTPAASPARPQALNILYFLDTTTGQARVLAGSARRALPHAFRGAFTTERILPGDRFDTWAAPAPVESIAAPALEAISVTEEGGRRTVRARLATNGAYRAVLRIPLSARPLSASVNGAAADFAETGGERRDFMSLACQGRACDGAEVSITLDAAGEGDADWFLIGQFPGLRTPATEALRARRPESATPIQFGDGALALGRVRVGGE
jgi:hypothetical protein